KWSNRPRSKKAFFKKGFCSYNKWSFTAKKGKKEKRKKEKKETSVLTSYCLTPVGAFTYTCGMASNYCKGMPTHTTDTIRSMILVL
ncbi:unnamed protein product, partial [Pylaiella littoralis]